MENFKTDIDRTSHDHIYIEQTCLLEESDIQCGYVFYNEITRLLKFYCTYCRETYDNIEYFCHHLSNHINESNDVHSEVDLQAFKKEEVDDEQVVEIMNVEDTTSIFLKNSDVFETRSYSSENNKITEDILEYEHQLDEISLGILNTESQRIGNKLNNEEMFMDAFDDAEKIQTEDEQEALDQMKDANASNFFFQENSSSTQIFNYEENHKLTTARKTEPIDSSKSGNSFEECFIKETNIDKIRTQGVCVLKEKVHKDRKQLPRKRSNIQDLLRLKRRRKKVTTVKVIAVKNRIAELYEKIQNVQNKSQQLYSNDFINIQQEQETQDAIESLIKDDTEDNKKDEMNKTLTNEASSEISRKIIGETLITLIPEGTKIPDKMPSLVSIPTQNSNNNGQLKPASSSDFNHYKVEDKNKLAICPACGKSFRSHFSLTIHKRIHYLESDSTVKLAHKCSDCDQLFNKLSQLKHHVETVHYPEGFICRICNRQLSSLSLLERHMVKVHLDRPFNCKKCNKNFSDHLTFEEHMASHNSGEVFKCTTCGRKYSTEFFLMEHMRNHKEQVPQTCVVCGKVTLRITQHMKIHTPRPKRLLSCSECGKVFNFSSGLSHHFKIMHKLPRPPPKPKKEIHTNMFKRKRRVRTNERGTSKKKQLLNPSSTDSSFVVDNERFPEQIIEQIEIPHEVYSTTTNAVIANLELNETESTEKSANLENSSCNYMSNCRGSDQMDMEHFEKGEVINHKEEEAKRVIVELIQNSTYTSFFPDNLSSVLEITPPIAREETISAVNSIVHES